MKGAGKVPIPGLCMIDEGAFVGRYGFVYFPIDVWPSLSASEADGVLLLDIPSFNFAF